MTPRLEILTPAEREHFEERASISEYDGNLPRAEAEALAWREVMQRRRPGTSAATRPARPWAAKEE